MLDEPLLLFPRSFFKNEQARQESRREGLFSDPLRGDSKQMGWSFLREPTKHEPELSGEGDIHEQDAEQVSGKSGHLIAESGANRWLQ